MTQYPATQGDQAKRNTGIVLTATRELFAEKDLGAIDRYWAEPYVRHSPQIPNGFDALRNVVPELQGFSWEP
jgi:predicted SnoaL-like aldol condensation-catalyzing enzyme